MVARTSREILRWLEGLYLTYPVVVPKWDLSNGYAYAEILHAYFPKDINMFYYINGRSLNARLLNWALVKQFLAKKRLPISIEYIDATLHGKDGGAESLLDQTYQLLTNKKPYIDPPYMRDEKFSDHPYQETLNLHQRSHASKSIKNNLKISELQTDPCLAYQAQRNQSVLDQAALDRQAIRAANLDRYNVKPTLAERCVRQPIRPDSSAQDWYMKSFDNRSVGSATNKSSSVKHQSRHASADGLRRSANRQPSIDKDLIQTDDQSGIYKEIVLRQHDVPLADLIQANES